MNKRKNLALFGGTPLVSKNFFPPHPVIDQAEKNAVMKVLDSCKLSSFIAARGDNFLGGEWVKKFEFEFKSMHDVKYAVAFNSATAALHAAVVACADPGTEVITTPYTFTSTATSVLMNNAVPVFADIEEDTFNINPEEIKKKITPLTRAIIPVHLFGQAANMDEIMKIAEEHNLKVIEDCAQAPLAYTKVNGKRQHLGTFGDCGIFSFTENKNMATGEGGMLITNDERIAEIARLVRNHGEAVVEGTQRSYNSTMLGWNYRMTEIQAALGRIQLSKLIYGNMIRGKLARSLTGKITSIDGFTAPVIPEGNTHVYYAYPIKYDEDIVGVPRAKFVAALNAEGVSFGAGYIKPLYYSQIYQSADHVAFKLHAENGGSADYSEGLCPVAERMHFKELIMTLLLRLPATEDHVNIIVNAIQKVISNKHEFEDETLV